MYKVTLLYGYPDDPEDFERYYGKVHSNVGHGVADRAVRAEKSKVIPDGDEPPLYYRISDLWFETKHDLDSTMSSALMQEAVDDLANFATGGSVILTSRLT